MVILKKKWLAAVLAGALLAAALLSGCSSVETVKRLRFGVAGEGGIYRESVSGSQHWKMRRITGRWS